MARGDDEYGTTGPQIAFPKLTPAVKAMLIVLAVTFVLQLLDQNWLPTQGRLSVWSVLFPRSVLRGQVWRLVTYPLVQPGGADVSALAFSAMTLYFFGGDLETLWGTRRFVLFSFLIVFLCGVVATLYGLVHPVFYTQPVLGVTPLGFGVTTAWGTRFPNRRLFFPPVSGKVLVYITLALALIPIIARAPSMSPAAAIGAIGIGWLLARYWDRIDDWLDRRKLAGLKRKRERILRGIPGGLSAKKGGKGQIDKRFLN